MSFGGRLVITATAARQNEQPGDNHYNRLLQKFVQIHHLPLPFIQNVLNS
jgi:hypothetical protein